MINGRAFINLAGRSFKLKEFRCLQNLADGDTPTTRLVGILQDEFVKNVFKWDKIMCY